MDVLLWLGVAYLAIRVMTKKRLRDLKFRWSLVLLAIGLFPIAYYLYGTLESQGVIRERYAYAHVSDIESGFFGMILFSPWFLIGAVILYFLERRARKQGKENKNG